MAESDGTGPEVAQLRDGFPLVRGRTMALLAGLSDEDCCVQSMPDASPVKWHLAHVTWFFETFILEKFEPGFQPFHPAFRVLFNSYYNGVGEKHARANRGLLTRPALSDVLAYREQVDRRMMSLIGRLSPAGNAKLAVLLELGLHHEQQHQELLLTDIKHLFSMNPLYPAYDTGQPPAAVSRESGWREFEGGVSYLGNGGNGFGFDNEFPRHRVFIEPFRLAQSLVTNAEYRAFIDAGGYADPSLWLSEGWDWRSGLELSAPMYWRRNGMEDRAQGRVEAGAQDGRTQGSANGRQWQEFTLHGLRALEPHAPVNHLSYFEADAYARWRDARLPTEAEWEHAAATDPASLHDLHGSRWQWTSSSYSPYPGYRPAAGAIGEYNGKFMVNQNVLRGSSFATPHGHARDSYRNFFPANARWQFTGLRLAQS